MNKPLSIVLLAVTLASPGRLSAQVADAGKLKPAVGNAYTRPLPELNFDSLPLSEVVGHLRDRFPEINFIVPEELEKIIVRLELRNVTLPEVLEGIQIATRAESLRIEQVNERLITFSQNPEGRTLVAAPRPVLRAFNLGRYLAGKDEAARGEAMKELHEVLADSWAMLQEADPSLRGTSPPRLRVHSGTQMLISVGNADQLQVLEEIVYNLPGMERPAQAHAGGGSGFGRPRTPDEVAAENHARFLDRYGRTPGTGSGTAR